MQRIADRFFLTGAGWIDAASGRRVRVLLEQSDGIDARDWDQQCAHMANARHPLLNPLVDYGYGPDGRRFEAYEASPAAGAAGAAGEIALIHATRFLRASGIALTSARSQLAVRVVNAGRARGERPLGITLQPRRALAAVQEALAVALPSGLAVISVSGPQQGGLRTLRTFIARAARLQGFVPVCATLLGSRDVGTLSPERHLCVLDDMTDGQRRPRDVTRHLMDLASASARGHIVVRFERLRSGRATIPLEPMSVRSLVGMVFVGDERDPGEEELFAAARAAEGRPGALIGQLGGTDFSRAPRGALAVHETSPTYDVEPPVPATPPPPARSMSCTVRALPRACALAARGRHASAMRVLRRAARVLSGRGQAEAAADCLVSAGRLALARGRTGEAASLFGEARQRSGAGAAAFRAAAGLGDAWTDEARFIEAAALLRGTLATADTVADARTATAVAAALVRTLYYQERYAEGIALVSSREWTDGTGESAALLAGGARCHAALGRIAPALRLARASQSTAVTNQQPGQIADAALALAEVLATAGDLGGMHLELGTVMRIARRAHLPLAAIEARLLESEHATAGDSSLQHQRIRRGLRASRLPVAARLRERIAASLAGLPEMELSAASAITLEVASAARRDGADALEALLLDCQHAADDAAAVAAVCSAVVRKLQAASAMVLSATERRVLAVEGRPWVAHSSVAAQTLATGMPAATEAGCEPREAAEPIRYGGELIAVLASRWTAGALVDGYGAAAVLHAAALAVAGSVRALVDRALPAAPPGAWGDMLGDSAAASGLRDSVARAARAPFPVLIEGESGSGKELVARGIHRLGPRRDRKFCAINCAALTDELVEAELFGHARGAFTGAATERAGLFEEADGGTLFLDEIGELSPRAQAKLLRVLQEGEVRRVGENFSRRVDPRLIAATNRRLEQEVSAGRFRADLRFRLDVVRISVPPLRERPGDIPLLATQFWNDASSRVGSRATLTGDALAALARHDWPGNVRELQNVVAWMAVHSPARGRIGSSALPAHLARAASPVNDCGFEAAREDFERRYIRAALAVANGQRAKAAQALGITRQGLAKMMRRLRIEVSS
ncbi:MAG: sigma-54 dependent transcriptional regulator [Vicinamibacterales bacterium]